MENILAVITKVYTWPIEHSTLIVSIISGWVTIIGAAELIAQHTETSKDDAVIGKIRGVSIAIIKILCKPWKIDVSNINFGTTEKE